MEGYANLAVDALISALDAGQTGSEWSVSDLEYHMDAIRDHYPGCDAQDTAYVFETLAAGCFALSVC